MLEAKQVVYLLTYIVPSSKWLKLLKSEIWVDLAPVFWMTQLPIKWCFILLD